MGEYTHIIDQKGIDALRAALGKQVHTIFSRRISVDGQKITAYSFSISLYESGFLSVSSDWGDTPKEYLDYWMIDVACSESPKGVASFKQNDQNMSSDLCDISLPLPVARIESIKVLSKKEQGKSESTYCDRAIIFERADGIVFSLSTPNTIAGWMNFSLDRGVAIDLEKQYETRVFLKFGI